MSYCAPCAFSTRAVVVRGFFLILFMASLPDFEIFGFCIPKYIAINSTLQGTRSYIAAQLLSLEMTSLNFAPSESTTPDDNATVESFAVATVSAVAATAVVTPLIRPDPGDKGKCDELLCAQGARDSAIPSVAVFF